MANRYLQECDLNLASWHLLNKKSDRLRRVNRVSICTFRRVAIYNKILQDWLDRPRHLVGYISLNDQTTPNLVKYFFSRSASLLLAFCCRDWAKSFRPASDKE